MLMKSLCLVALAVLAASCSNPSPVTPANKPAATQRSIADIQRTGAKFKDVLRLPEFETTPEAIKATAEQTMAAANAALDAIGRLDAGQVRFGNTVGALDDITFQVSGAMNRLYLIKETSTDSAVRDAATDAVKRLQEWAVGLDYREDVYRAIKAYADTKPKLTGEDERLLTETMRDYRRAGLALPKAQRDEVERLRKELSNVSTDFDSNVTKAKKSLKFNQAELAGAPDTLLNAPGIKTGDDEYTVQLNVTWQYLSLIHI